MHGLSPHRYWNQVSPLEVQAWLRDCFERWGRPSTIRVDNGTPWGSSSDLPSALALWLIGLGITMAWNPPNQPTANGKIERFNGLIDAWAEPQRCPSWPAWQERITWLVHMQSAVYPSVHGQSRLQAFPALRTVEAARRYRASREAAEWQLAHVTQFLATLCCPRKVDSSAKISIYGQGYKVGKRFRRQTVWLRFDPVHSDWVVQDNAGTEVKRWPASEITADGIRNLKVGAYKHMAPPSHHQQQ
jgi:hypothetical protein